MHRKSDGNHISADGSKFRKFCDFSSAEPGSRTYVFEHTELDGLLVSSYDEVLRKEEEKRNSTSLLSPIDCCRACTENRHCNLWVFCEGEATCTGQCWLKYTYHPREDVLKYERIMSEGISSPWISGVLAGKGIIPGKVTPKPKPTHPKQIRLRLNSVEEFRGREIVINLRPELSESSVNYLSKMLEYKDYVDDICLFCSLYRTEKDFLIQGRIHGVNVAKGLKTGVLYEGLRGPPMKQFDVAWAGGFGGPDFFITTNPNGYSGGEIVFGNVTDIESQKVILEIESSPFYLKPHSTMRFLENEIEFDVDAP